MESPLIDPRLDGTGGGFGKYPGFTVKDLNVKFNEFAEQGDFRALSGVLRMTHEQLDARGGLGHYPVLATIAFAAVLVAQILKPFAMTTMKPLMDKISIGGGVVGMILLFGVVKTFNPLRECLAQEKAIRKISIEALDKIVSSSEFKPKALNEDQRRTLVTLLKKTGRKEGELYRLL